MFICVQQGTKCSLVAWIVFICLPRYAYRQRVDRRSTIGCYGVVGCTRQTFQFVAAKIQRNFEMAAKKDYFVQDDGRLDGKEECRSAAPPFGKITCRGIWWIKTFLYFCGEVFLNAINVKAFAIVCYGVCCNCVV